MEQHLKRISLMIREDQYKTLNEQGLKISGLIRDLVDDHLSDHKITIAVSEETKVLYDKIVSNTGTSDADLEVYFKHCLQEILDDKIKQMQQLQNELKEKNS